MIRKFPPDTTTNADEYGKLTREMNRLIHKIRFDLEELSIEQLKKVEKLITTLKETK